jgi:protein SCO1/2
VRTLPKLAVILTAFIACAFLWMQTVRTLTPRPPLATPATSPVDRALPDFQLTESHGQPITLSDLRGKVWVANLMFTACPDVCVALAQRLGELDRQLGPRDNVRLV